MIVKDSVPDDPQDFSFTDDITALLPFSLDDDADGTLSNTETFTNVLPGAYTVTEGAVAGWDLTGLTCDDGNSTGSTGTGVASINLEAGETVRCTLTNTKLGRIIVDKVTRDADGNVLPGDPTLFPFSITGSDADLPDIFSIDESDTPHQSPLLDPGSYTVTETLPSGWFLLTANCNSDLGNPNQDPSSSSVSVAAGETLTCTFTNQVVAVPSIGIEKSVVEVDGDTVAPFEIDAAGDVVTYLIVVTNTGNQTLTGVSVADPLLADLDCDGVAGVPLVTSGFTLAPSATLTCTGTYTVLQSDIDSDATNEPDDVAAGDLDNEATTDSDQTGPQSDTQAVPLAQDPEIDVTKDSTTTGVGVAGEVIPYTYVVTNVGNQTLSGVTLTDNNTDRDACL